MRAVFRWQERRAARAGLVAARSGAVDFVQRFSSSLALTGRDGELLWAAPADVRAGLPARMLVREAGDERRILEALGEFLVHLDPESEVAFLEAVGDRP